MITAGAKDKRKTQKKHKRKTQKKNTKEKKQKSALGLQGLHSIAGLCILQHAARTAHKT
jgi:hypothetical protein